MTLRNRFRLLLLVFGISIISNVLVSVWCVHIYINRAVLRFDSLVVGLRETEHIRRLIEELIGELKHHLSRDATFRDTRYKSLSAGIAQRIDNLQRKDDSDEAEPLPQLRLLAEQLETKADQFVALLDEEQNDEAVTLLQEGIIQQCVAPLNRQLSKIASQANRAMISTSSDVSDKAGAITLLLSLNAAAAFLLAALGVQLVRNWVLRPIGSLAKAAEQHAAGNLHHRIEPVTNDELGTLSQDINRMADSLLENQRRLVERERLAAIGEITSMVAHNIRNPLAGIRASAQASLAELPDGNVLRNSLTTIVETVDSLNSWLRELLRVGQPIALECELVSCAEIIDPVLSVLRSNSDRNHIRLETNTNHANHVVYADPKRIEQVVLTLVANAVEASPGGTVVRVEVQGNRDTNRTIIRVIDEGAGISQEMLTRMAQPFVSTKPGGTGVGLYLANRTVQAHCGRLEFSNNRGRGTTVALELPASAPDLEGD